MRPFKRVLIKASNLSISKSLILSLKLTIPNKSLINQVIQRYLRGLLM